MWSIVFHSWRPPTLKGFLDDIRQTHTMSSSAHSDWQESWSLPNSKILLSEPKSIYFMNILLHTHRVWSVILNFRKNFSIRLLTVFFVRWLWLLRGNVLLSSESTALESNVDVTEGLSIILDSAQWKTCISDYISTCILINPRPLSNNNPNIEEDHWG